MKSALMIVAACAVPVGLHAASYRALDPWFIADAVSDSGMVSGQIRDPFASNYQYGYYAPGGSLTFIGGLPADFNTAQTYSSSSVSRDGSQISYNEQGLIGSFGPEAATYNVITGVTTRLGGLGATANHRSSTHYGSSPDGQIIVGSAAVSSTLSNAAVFTNGTVTNLGSSVAGRGSRALAVNADGTVVAGYQELSSGFYQAAIWTGGTQTLLSYNGERVGAATKMTPDGRYVVGSGDSFTTNNNAYRYDRTTQTFAFLGVLPGANSTSASTGISDDGKIIVGYQRASTTFNTSNGTIWIEGQGLMDLTAFVTSLGVDLGGIRLSNPMAISPDGTQIVGFHYVTGSQAPIAFLVTIPEPTSLAVFGAGTLLLRRRRA